MEKSPYLPFIEKVKTSIAQDTFVRLSLSKKRKADDELKKIIIRVSIIKNTRHLTFVYRYPRKDITKNYPLEKAYVELLALMQKYFLIYNLFTTIADWTLEHLPKGNIKTKQKPPTFSATPYRLHDKMKNHLIAKADYLYALGILNAQGNIKKDKGDKYKQINKFVEIIDALLKNQKDFRQKAPLKVVDMGAGKGYLTFALYDYLHRQQNIKTEILGVEIRKDLVDKSNAIAEQLSFEQLHFEEGFIQNYELPATDILIALHACDTATDDAIAKGIAAGAQLILCAPCCHKQIRQEIKDSNTFHSVLRHGILKERQAEILTDTIRALLLESKGYKTKVFEFISTEHTGKNLMIAAQKHHRQVDCEFFLSEIQKLKNAFGIGEHYLEKLLRG